jgi:hypothetical protein
MQSISERVWYAVSGKKEVDDGDDECVARRMLLRLLKEIPLDGFKLISTVSCVMRRLPKWIRDAMWGRLVLDCNSFKLWDAKRGNLGSNSS